MSYSRINWENKPSTNTPINAENLNKMDAGIAAVTASEETTASKVAVLEGRVDEITTLPEGSTSGDAELADIRVGADGVTYQNAGTAVRTQINNVKNELSDITRKLEYVRSENLCRGDNTVMSGYMGTDGRIFTSQTLVYTEKIPVNVGEVIRAYCVVDGTFAQRALRFVTAFDESGNVMSSVGADNTWSYTVPDGVTYIVISTTSGTNYMVAVGAVKTAYIPYDGYYKATDDFIGDILTNRFGEKVDKDGIEQVKTANIEGMTEAGAGISDNLFPKATLVANDKYVAGIGGLTGKAYLSDGSGYVTYIIPVDGLSTYTFTNCRTAIVVSDLEYTPVGELLSNTTNVDSTGGKYILFSFKLTTYPVNSYSITKPVTKYTIPSNWIIPDESNLKKPIGSVNGTGTLNITGRSALRDGELIIFKGFFDVFAEFSLNFTNISTITNFITVDTTNITIKNNTATPTPQPHGLTIQNDVTLTVQFIDGTAKITLHSNGESWTSTVPWYQTNGTVTQPQVAPNEMSFTNAILNVVYDAVSRGIWYFGDSYTGITSPDRWVYYLKEDGFSGNALINGSAGSTSSGANTALSELLQYGTPKFAVMATGMNDGSDTDGNPPNLWINSRDAFITACQNNGIEPIFATIPTVPTVNNEAKNAWVKASGYRYIDFAKAVGADGTGTWYSGMLSVDNVHPTAKGAKALYTQVLIDMPEVTLSN